MADFLGDYRFTIKTIKRFYLASDPTVNAMRVPCGLELNSELTSLYANICNH